MVSGGQPFQAPDTRRLEQRIRSRQAAALLDGQCPVGLQAITAKLLAGYPADRYGSATAIRDDLQCVELGKQTQAEREGWPTRGQDEPATRRTRSDEEATRRTLQSQTAPQTAAPSVAQSGRADANTGTVSKRSRWGKRFLAAALLLAALSIIGNEMSVARQARRLAAVVSTVELDGLGETWRQYDALKGRSSSFRTIGLERALTQQSTTLADRVIANYRTPLPTVREAQWRMAREALAHVLSVSPDDAQVKGSLRYCDGHLHRINGDARKARKLTSEAQREFTDAVTAFREAAELRPNWPDPFLGLMRTFIYGLEDVDRGADALSQARRLGYTPGDREAAQLADGYRARAETFARTARTLSGLPQEQEWLTRAVDAYRQALDLYAKALGFADVPRTMRAAQRGLEQLEKRLADVPRPIELPQ